MFYEVIYLPERKYVEVIARHTTEGKCYPIEIIWEDGRRFEIDRIMDIRRAASLKAGGAGIRYLCRIINREIYIFDDNGRWFLESRS
jgi:hypothetical protein